MQEDEEELYEEKKTFELAELGIPEPPTQMDAEAEGLLREA